MSSLAVTNALMSVLVPIGIAGAVIALTCALVATFALARGSAGLAGGGIGLWIVGAMLSMCASFANLWTPVLLSLIALGAALVAGPLLRVALRRRTHPASTSAPESSSHVVAATAERMPKTRPAGIAASSVTGALPVVS